MEGRIITISKRNKRIYGASEDAVQIDRAATVGSILPQPGMEIIMKIKTKWTPPAAADIQVGNKLAEKLQEQGWSVSGFCRDNGLSRSTVQNIINGRRNPSLTLLRRLADALGIAAGELL